VPPLPSPNADQANWPDQAPGTRPEQPTEAGRRPGQPSAPQPGAQPGPQQLPDAQQVPPFQQPAGAPAPVAGPPRSPAQSPGPALGPQGSPHQPAPWHDPHRYTPAGRRPQQQERPQRGQQRGGEEPGKRPPLSLRTRWARGLALGGAACTLITLLNGYRNFPVWLIAAVTGLLMSLGGLWMGTFAQRDATRQAQRAPEAVASVVWSGISTLIALAVVSYSLVFFPQLRQYSDCMRAANTISGQNVCQQQFERSLTVVP
jgi:hypothetical protein